MHSRYQFTVICILVKIFSHPVDCLFVWLTVSFVVQKPLISCSSLLILGPRECWILFLFKTCIYFSMLFPYNHIVGTANYQPLLMSPYYNDYYSPFRIVEGMANAITSRILMICMWHERNLIQHNLVAVLVQTCKVWHRVVYFGHIWAQHNLEGSFLM